MLTARAELPVLLRLGQQARLVAACALMFLTVVVHFAAEDATVTRALACAAAGWLLLAAAGRPGRAVRAQALLLLAADTMLITFLANYTGGLGSIAAALYLPVIVHAAVLFGLEGAFLLATLATLCFAALNLGKLLHLPPLIPYFAYERWLYADRPLFAIVLTLITFLFYLAALFAGKGSAVLATTRADLRQERDLNAEIVAHIGAAVAVLDGDLQVVRNNDVFTALYDPLFPLPEALAAGHGTETAADLVAALRGSDGFARERVVWRRHGAERFLQWRATRAAGQPGRWLLVIVDMTASVRQLTLQAQQQRLAATGRMAAGVAHELNNPLGAISSYVQYLHAKGEPVPAVKLQPVIDETNRAARIIRELLHLARGSSGAADNGGSCDAAAAARETLTLLQPQLAKQQVTVDLHVPERLPVAAGRDRFTQVLLNLLLNALDAVAEGGQIRLALVVDGTQAVLTVADNGCGMSAEQLERAGEPFHTTKEAGTGLGLAVSRQFVVDWGGTLRLASVAGGGTTARVTLPRAEAPT